MDYTDNGMIADPNEMLLFVHYLKQQIDELKATMDKANQSVVKMNQAGYSDKTFLEFQEKFNEEIKFVNDLNAKLDKSAEYYMELVKIVSGYLDNGFQGSFNRF